MSSPQNDHFTIAAAGWHYRIHPRGWVVYRDPGTGLWHTRREAMVIVNRKQAFPGKDAALSQPGPVRRGADGTILNASELSAEQLAGQKVLCPGCGAMTFPVWPDGWELHAASDCGAVAQGSDNDRRSNFQRLFGDLFP